MKKIFNIFLLAISATISLQGANGKTKADHTVTKTSFKKGDSPDFNSSLKATPWVTVTVANAPDLTAAIETAANNPAASTIIYIDGTILGSFTIPATINQIKLVGTGISPTISPDDSGDSLTILTTLLGANVSIEKLTITDPLGYAFRGIVNYGSLRIFQTTVRDVAEGLGIYNLGQLLVDESSINNNGVYGIESEQGVVKVTNSSINNNSSRGIYLLSGVGSIENSSINENGDEGIYSQYGVPVTIKDCQVNGNAGYGIRNVLSATTSILDTIIENNTSGGIYNDGCICSIKDSTVSNHTGSGIYNIGGALLDVKNCTFSNNSNSAIYNDDLATLFVDGSIFRDNSSTDNGGAIYNDSSSVVTVSNCIFTTNTAVSGGAIYNGHLFTLLNSKVRKNVATADGAGIYNDSSGSFVARSVAIRDNVTTSGEGGGMYNSGTATVVDSRIKYNSASKGGGFANISPLLAELVTTSSENSLSITNSIVKHNIATFGVDGGGGIYNTATLTTQTSNISENIPDQIAP